MLRSAWRRALQAVALLTAILPATVPAAETAAVAPEPFFRHADHRSLQLSPSGRYLGVLVPVGGRVRLAIIDVDTRSSRVAAALPEDVDWFAWVNDDRLVFASIDLQAGFGAQHGGGLLAVNRDGTEYRVLAPTARMQEARRQMVYRYTRLHTLLHDGSDDILVVANDGDERYPLVYRLNTKTGRKTLKTFENPGNVIRWVADRNGDVRAALAVEKGTIYKSYWRPDGNAKWVQLAESRLRDSRIVPVAFDGDGTLLVSSNVGSDKWAIFRYDSDKKSAGELMVAHAQIDVTGGIVFDRRKNRVVGVVFDADRPGSAWLDEDWARVQKTVDAALPGRMNVLQRADTRSRALVFSYSDTDPGSYYLLDLDRLRLEFVAAQRKAIDPESMPARRPVRYAARDGLEIPAYLTLPRNKGEKNLPLVLYVHGGPWVRGAHWRWSAEPAYLASLGYAVLEPEFRGSAGWGTRLAMAGWKQWGRAMQDDLNDGVDWLAKEGTIDPKRVCIMGASYGGYAVMMGLARDPDRWRCGINQVGVTDINLMFDVTWSDMSGSDYLEYTAKDMIGDPDADAAMLKAASPLENAAKVKAPVLMAYGSLDRRVPLVHGEKMRDALVRQGKQVEWVVYADEGHSFLLERNRFDFYGRVAKFLAAHLGGN